MNSGKRKMSEKSLANLQKGKKFKKGDERINRKGRPPKFKVLLDGEPLTPSQVQEVIAVMLNMTVQELKYMFEAEEVPAFMKLIAKMTANSIVKGDGSQVFNYMLNRAFGQPKQEIEHSTATEVNLVIKGRKSEEKKGEGA